MRYIRRPLSVRFNRIVSDRIDHFVQHTLGLQPFGEFDERDVFIVGFPKSGNTWAQNLMAGLVYGINTHHTPDVVIQELVPEVHRQLKHYYQRFSTPMYFKSHYLPRAEYRNVIYLLRDGRDAIVSYYHFIAALQGEAPDFYGLVTSSPQTVYGDWHQHVNAWQANPYNARMLVVKYEDLLADTALQLRRVCEFTGIQRSDTQLAEVAAQNDFSSMKKRERTFGMSNPDWPKDKSFVRRGEVGAYRDEMPANVLEAFMQIAGPTLQQYGYL